jgi:hypothetical protein
MPEPTEPSRTNPSKLAAVRNYLEHKFPGRLITDRHETDTITEVFTIENTATHDAHRVKVSREFLDDNDPQLIMQKLRRWHVAETLTASGRSPVRVTSHGVSAEEG